MDGMGSSRGGRADPAAALEFARSAPEDRAGGGRYELIAVSARGFRPPKFLDVARTVHQATPLTSARHRTKFAGGQESRCYCNNTKDATNGITL